MDQEALIDEIIKHSIELFFELRQNQFSKEHFKPFIRALKSYRGMIRGKRKIEREVAATLHEIEIAFIGALDHARPDKEKLRAIGKAHEEFVPIMMDILNPKSDSKPLP